MLDIKQIYYIINYRCQAKVFHSRNKVTRVTVSKIKQTKISSRAKIMSNSTMQTQKNMIRSLPFKALTTLIKVAIFKLKASTKVSETYNKSNKRTPKLRNYNFFKIQCQIIFLYPQTHTPLLLILRKKWCPKANQSCIVIQDSLRTKEDKKKGG